MRWICPPTVEASPVLRVSFFSTTLSSTLATLSPSPPSLALSPSLSPSVSLSLLLSLSFHSLQYLSLSLSLLPPLPPLSLSVSVSLSRSIPLSPFYSFPRLFTRLSLGATVFAPPLPPPVTPPLLPPLLFSSLSPGRVASRYSTATGHYYYRLHSFASTSAFSTFCLLVFPTCRVDLHAYPTT